MENTRERATLEEALRKVRIKTKSRNENRMRASGDPDEPGRGQMPSYGHLRKTFTAAWSLLLGGSFAGGNFALIRGVD